MNASEPASDLIFIYGSLLPKAPRTRHHLLGPVSGLGVGYFRGRLYSLEGYPGAVASSDPADRVLGDVYRLENAPEALRRLDRYEGFLPDSPEDCEFVRVTTSIRLDTRAAIPAWIYLYTLSVAGLVRIEHGDYLRFLSGNK